ncbi:MAG: phosphatase PAP2 family protein [Planctomycetota bacterium]
MNSDRQRSIDHNRGLATPVAAVHAAFAPVGPLVRWLRRPRHRHTLLPIVLGVAIASLLFPFDGLLGGAINGLDERNEAGKRLLGGDVIRELSALGQFGGLSSVVLAGVAVYLLDPARRRALWNLAAAAGSTSIAVLLCKAVIGRPRPKFDEPSLILGPFAAYPLGPGEGVHHAWEVWAGISSDLWSMPSSHTSGATALAVFLALTYPRLRWLVVSWVAVVAFSRVLFGAHWPSDVVLGAAVGYAVSHAAVTQGWGTRLATRVGLLGAGAPEPGRA